jgi:hypothetical protein
VKSAEEWVKRVTHEDGHVASMYVEDIRAIQADALRHAAAIADSFCSGWTKDELLKEATKLEAKSK